MTAGAREEDVDTPHGRARIVVEGPCDPSALVVLGHGAGGGVEAPDLLAVRDVALAVGGAVARVLQPYRVAGRRAPAPAAQLDAAWAAVVERLHARFPGASQIHGGRSSGARVACRGAVALPPELRPVGVVALAFPLLAPARKDGHRPDRGPELDGVSEAGLPVLAVSGDRDRFGVPGLAEGREVVVVSGDHSLRSRHAVAAAARAWLRALADTRSAWSAGTHGVEPVPVERAWRI